MTPDNSNWADEANVILEEMTLAYACAGYSYTAGGLRVVNGELKTPQEIFDALSPEEQDKIKIGSYSAFMVMSSYGFYNVMNLAFEEHLSEK